MLTRKPPPAMRYVIVERAADGTLTTLAGPFANGGQARDALQAAWDAGHDAAENGVFDGAPADREPLP